MSRAKTHSSILPDDSPSSFQLDYYDCLTFSDTLCFTVLEGIEDKNRIVCVCLRKSRSICAKEYLSSTHTFDVLTHSFHTCFSCSPPSSFIIITVVTQHVTVFFDDNGETFFVCILSKYVIEEGERLSKVTCAS